ncbi:protein-disulfide reductase DsbD [Luteimonas mephitis]|uniref:protein-disulfide reductase DsbD n=1 Tax=Luteimonas mephitis TaxID=83615 RepID=UPI001FE1BF43|nr:protein-disulfide reductase DsbD [Luteimonas mephitis]
MLAVFLLSLAAGAAGAASLLQGWGDDSGKEFLDASEVFVPGQPLLDGDTWRIETKIADGYYVYRHTLRAEDLNGGKLTLELPSGQPHHDEFFGDTEVYEPPGLTLRLSSEVSGPVTIHWQGCAVAGICYPPQTLTVALPARSGIGNTAASAAGTAVSPPVDPGDDASNAAANATSTRSVNPTAQTPTDSASDAVAAIPAASASSAENAVGAPPAPDASLTAPAQEDLAEDQATAARLATLGPLAGALLFFGFGLLLAFTPCTLPMIPIVSGLIVGGGAAPRRALALSATYVLAMAVTYAAVGVAAGLAGANLQAALQSPWLLGAFAALFLVLAASLFGMFELRLPAVLANRLERASRSQQGGSLAGAAALGLLSALLVGPCMTAPLAGALLYIGQTGSALVGGLALFALGLGMGLPLVLIAVFGARVLPKPGPWMERVRTVFGYVMVAMAILMLVRVVSGPIGLLLWGTWALAVAVGLFAWAHGRRDDSRGGWSLRFASLLAGFWSCLMLVGAAAGGDSVLHPLERFGTATAATTTTSTRLEYVAAKSVQDVNARIAEAGARGQWTLIDFYADWCVSCHVIEREVFGDATVAARLAGVQVLRPDVTDNDAIDRELLGHWQVPGPPTLILVGPDGRERRAQRSVGEVDARGFLAKLDAAGAP